MSEYNILVESLQAPKSITLAEKAKQLKDEGREILSLTIGEPNFDTPKPIVDCAVREMRSGNTHYVASRGLPELRTKIAEKLRNENGIECVPNQIIVTPGAKYSIYIAIRTLLNEGDEAIIPCPCWVSYSSLVTVSGGKPVELELDYENNYAITEEKLESVVSDRTKLLIVNSPNNPTCHILSEEEINIIRKFVIKHNIYVISDEIYEKIVFDGNKNPSLASFSDIADKVITVNGFSKSVAMTGWRIGYLCAEQKLCDKIFMLFQHTMTCIPGFTQKAAEIAFDCVEETENMRKAFERRRDNFLNVISKCPAISVHKSEGAFYAWAKINYKGMDCYQLSDYLLSETGVMGVPGDAYGLGGKYCIRFSLSNDDAVLDEAARRIVKAFSK